MAKMIVEIPYGAYVIDAKDAIALAQMMAGAERYRSKYHSGSIPTTHHIYPVEGDTNISMRLITDDNYRMFKLAGKPED